MSMELAGPILAAKQASTQQQIGIKVMKQQHKMDMALVDMITEVTQSAPQPGQGSRVDKTA